MGGGILPVAIHKGEILFLFSREWIKSSDDGGLWSDFGGSKEKNESYKETAIREGYEESLGILGNKKKINYYVNNKTLKEIQHNGYKTFVILIDYDKNLPKKFRKKFLHALEYKYNEVKKHNGLWEKDMIRWFTYKEIKHKYNIFRPWYKNIIKQLLREF